MLVPGRMKATSSSRAIASSRVRRCSRVRLPKGLAVEKSKRNSRNPCSSDSGGISRPSWSITGPRVSAALKFAREVPPLGRGLVSLYCMSIRWGTPDADTSCVTSPQLAPTGSGARFFCHGLRRQLADEFVHQPGTDGAGDEADQAVHDELECTGIRPAAAVEQFGGDEGDGADKQHAQDRRDAPDMREDVVD